MCLTREGRVVGGEGSRQGHPRASVTVVGVRSRVGASAGGRRVGLVDAPKPLTGDFVAVAKAERERLAVRLAEAQERVAHFDACAAEVREEAESLARLIRDLEEMLGMLPQIAMCEIDEELRGGRLREVALDVLREKAGDGTPIHYREWFRALNEAGFRVVGKDPLASFLTQVSRMERVERIGRRTGLYRLRLAA